MVYSGEGLWGKVFSRRAFRLLGCHRGGYLSVLVAMFLRTMVAAMALSSSFLSQGALVTTAADLDNPDIQPSKHDLVLKKSEKKE